MAKQASSPPTTPSSNAGPKMMQRLASVGKKKSKGQLVMENILFAQETVTNICGCSITTSRGLWLLFPSSVLVSLGANPVFPSRNKRQEKKKNFRTCSNESLEDSRSWSTSIAVTHVENLRNLGFSLRPCCHPKIWSHLRWTRVWIVLFFVLLRLTLRWTVLLLVGWENQPR